MQHSPPGILVVLPLHLELAPLHCVHPGEPVAWAGAWAEACLILTGAAVLGMRARAQDVKSDRGQVAQHGAEQGCIMHHSGCLC